MPKPNYSFQKRQRELAKKQKKEEKKRLKDEARAPADPAATGTVTPADPDTAGPGA